MELSEDESDDGFGIRTPVPKIEVDEISVQIQRNISLAIFDAELRHSRAMLPFPASAAGFPVRMPWEAASGVGIWSDMLSNTFVTNRPVFRALAPEPVPVQTELRAQAKKLFPGVVRRLPFVPWPQQVVAKRHNVLLKWRLIIEENFGATKLGLQLQEASLDIASNDTLAMIIQDAFSERPTTTLAKRANPLLKFFVWCRKSYGVSGAPVVEKRAYEYLKMIIQAKAAPTAPASFVSALNFAAFFVGMDGAADATSSLRIKGASHAHYLLKRPLKQSKTLKVVWVAIFEDGVFSCMEPSDRIACGFFASLTHCRGRFSDIQLTKKAILDTTGEGDDIDGFVEYPNMDIKTARTKEDKTTFLNFVAPIRGVCNRPWATQWLKERELQGISGFSCLLPSLSVDGTWIDDPVNSSTASNWMKLILSKYGVPYDDLEGVSSHSCKSTALSWCAKFNMDIETRTLLGHHSLPSATTCLTYSRDAQSGPLRQYVDMLKNIRNKTFDPDLTRSGRFAKRTLGKSFEEVKEDGYTAGHDYDSVHCSSAAVQTSHLQAECPAVDELPFFEDLEKEVDSTSESSSSSSGSEADSKGLEMLSKRKAPVVLDPVGSCRRVCKTSQLLHLLLSSNNSRFRCGRTVSKNYEAVDSFKESMLAVCTQCFPTVPHK